MLIGLTDAPTPLARVAAIAQPLAFIAGIGLTALTGSPWWVVGGAAILLGVPIARVRQRRSRARASGPPEALSSGRLGIDKVVELARFATLETEARLISWATRVSCGAVRRRGDLELRSSREEMLAAERERSVSWWYFDEGRRFGLEAELPAAQGAIVAKALQASRERATSAWAAPIHRRAFQSEMP